MAVRYNGEVFANAVIDLSDMTITEIHSDGVQVHSLEDLLDRWDGLEGVTLTIERARAIHGKAG